jgi:pyruvate, orthophosphate dikinase
MTNPSKNIVRFGGSAEPVPNPDKNILGGKGLGLQEMTSVGIDVPPGFTLTTALCQAYQVTGDLTEEVWEQTKCAIADVENDMGRKFGDPTNPLLISCRSGAAQSMPGMMDTVLNVVCSVVCSTPWLRFWTFRSCLCSKFLFSLSSL